MLLSLLALWTATNLALYGLSAPDNHIPVTIRTWRSKAAPTIKKQIAVFLRMPDNYLDVNSVVLASSHGHEVLPTPHQTEFSQTTTDDSEETEPVPTPSPSPSISSARSTLDFKFASGTNTHEYMCTPSPPLTVAASSGPSVTHSSTPSTTASPSPSPSPTLSSSPSTKWVHLWVVAQWLLGGFVTGSVLFTIASIIKSFCNRRTQMISLAAETMYSASSPHARPLQHVLLAVEDAAIPFPAIEGFIELHTVAAGAFGDRAALGLDKALLHDPIAINPLFFLAGTSIPAVQPDAPAAPDVAPQAPNPAVVAALAGHRPLDAASEASNATPPSTGAPLPALGDPEDRLHGVRHPVLEGTSSAHLVPEAVLDTEDAAPVSVSEMVKRFGGGAGFARRGALGYVHAPLADITNDDGALVVEGSGGEMKGKGKERERA